MKKINWKNEQVQRGLNSFRVYYASIKPNEEKLGQLSVNSGLVENSQDLESKVQLQIVYLCSFFVVAPEFRLDYDLHLLTKIIMRQ